MTIIAQLADGTELHFPDGTAPEVIQRTVKNMVKSAAPEAVAPETVATTQDGGKVTKDAKGNLSFSSPAYSTNDPAKIAEIMKGATPADISMRGFDQSTLDQAGAAGPLSKFVQGIPFAGQWVDELAGSLAGQDAQQGVRAAQSAMDRQRPGTSAALQIGGGVVGAIPMAMTAAPGIAAAAPQSLAGQMLAGGVAGAASGAAEGAVSGAGAANDGNRMDGAKVGGLVGGSLGGMLGGAAPALLKGLQSGSRTVINWFKKTDVAGITKALGVSGDAAQIIKTHLEADDFRAAADALRKAGPDGMLADTSQQASQLLDTSIAAGGPSMQIARDAVEGRAAAASGRLTAAMDATLGPAPEGMKAAAKSVAGRTAASRAEAYKAAYASPIDYASDAGRAIEGVLGRIPTKTVNAAVQEANDAMKEAGEVNMQIMATVAPDGSVTFSQPLNVQQLDYLKRALGTLSDAERDQFGRLTGPGQRAARLASDLKDALGKAVPGYLRAVKLGGDKIAEDKALQLGRDLLKPSVTRETVRETMSGASLEAKQAAAQGIRTAFDEAMANVKATAGNPSTEAAEALKAVKEFSSQANRQKAEIILGKTKAEKLFAAFDEAASQIALRAAIAKGSQTATRTAGKQAMDAIIEGNPLDLLKQGKPAEAARGIVQILTDATPAARIKKTQAIYGEVARALVEKRGPDAMQALGILQGAIRGAPVSQAQADLVAKAVTASASALAYQLGSQTQRQ